MARTLFFCMVFRKFSEITFNNTPIFRQHNIFYKNKHFYFQSEYLFVIIAKKPNLISNNVVCVVARLVSAFSCALTMGRCNRFQNNFRKLKEIGVLRPIFPD